MTDRLTRPELGRCGDILDVNPPKAHLPGKDASCPQHGEGGCPFEPGRVRRPHFAAGDVGGHQRERPIGHRLTDTFNLAALRLLKSRRLSNRAASTGVRRCEHASTEVPDGTRPGPHKDRTRCYRRAESQRRCGRPSLAARWRARFPRYVLRHPCLVRRGSRTPSPSCRACRPCIPAAPGFPDDIRARRFRSAVIEPRRAPEAISREL